MYKPQELWPDQMAKSIDKAYFAIQIVKKDGDT